MKSIVMFYKMLWHCILITIISIGVIRCYPDGYELQLVQMVYRHGDRAPVKLYPKDPNPESVWEGGLGKLTLLGKRQHWSLGRFLRFLYDGLITTNSNEIDVRSCTDDRCINSAACNLATFYAPKANCKFYYDVPWQPIPIHPSPSEKYDKYLNQLSKCPKAEMYEKEDKEALFNTVPKDMLNNLRLYSGYPLKDFLELELLYDTLWIEQRYNLIIPDWIKAHWAEIDDALRGQFYKLYEDPRVQYFRGGPLIGLIIEKMKKKVRGLLPNLKVQVFSAHDSTIAPLLGILHFAVPKTIPYASTLIFELYSGPDEGKFVRLLYFNSTHPERIYQQAHVLTIKGCQEFCPLNYIIQLTKPLIPKKWRKECNE